MGSEKIKFKNLKERILKENDTLFFIVIDEGKKPLPQWEKALNKMDHLTLKCSKKYN